MQKSKGKKMVAVAVALAFVTHAAFGWGELGHRIIAESAAEIVGQHPLLRDKTGEERSRVSAFVSLIRSRRLMEAHVTNIPDIYWRNLDGGLEEDGQLLGDAAHFLNTEGYLPVSPETISRASDFLALGIPLDFEAAKRKFTPLVKGGDFFHTGTLPWRAQQFATLSTWALRHARELDNRRATAEKTHVAAVPSPATEIVLAYAALMAHMTGDASQPYHVTSDYDGQRSGQKGVHSYFESRLVDALEDEALQTRVEREARQRLTAKGGETTVAAYRDLVRTYYPDANADDDAAALTLVLAADSYSHIQKVLELDRTYAIATFGELRQNPSCAHLPLVRSLETALRDATPEQRKRILAKKLTSPLGEAKAAPACRRSPFARVTDDGSVTEQDAPTVAERFADEITSRLAIAAAVTADIWVRQWIAAGEPRLGFTYQYALKPSFVSPTDPKCAGYALNEDPAHFAKKAGGSALPYRKAAASTEACLSF